MGATSPVSDHPHRKLMLAITIAVLVVAAVAVTYYVWQTRLIQSETVSRAPTAPAPAQDAVSPTATTTDTAVIVSDDASATVVAKELNQLNVAEIEAAIRELQAALNLLQ